MNLFTKLDQLVDLTDNEKTLVAYIKEHPYDFINQEIQDICQRCYVSKATLYRLCKKLELHGCAMLKMAVSTSLQDAPSKNINYDYPITSTQSQYEVLQSLTKLYESTIHETMNLFDLQTLQDVAVKLKMASEIDIYTSAGNLYFAHNFRFQMSEIDVNIQVPNEEYEQHWLAARSTPDKIAIIISFGGRGRFTQAITKLLKKNKTPIVLITSTQKSPISSYADDTIYLASNEDHSLKISSFGTRLSLLYILDTLYACYFKLDYDKHNAFKTKTYEKMTSVQKQ